MDWLSEVPGLISRGVTFWDEGQDLERLNSLKDCSVAMQMSGSASIAAACHDFISSLPHR